MTDLVPTNEPNNLLQLIAEKASDENFNADKMRVMYDMVKDEKKSRAEDAFNAAVMKFQLECPAIVKTSKGNNSKYAKLDNILQLIRPVLKDNGLVVRFTTGRNGENTTVTCILSHMGGHTEQSYWEGSIPTNKATNAAQTSGMAITYGQRYTLLPMLGIVAEDDNDARPVKSVTSVTPDQILEMEGLLASAGKNVIDMCRYYKIDSINKMTEEQFVSTKRTLEAEIRTAQNEDS